MNEGENNFQALAIKANTLFCEGSKIFIEDGDVTRTLRLYEEGLKLFEGRTAGTGNEREYVERWTREVVNIRTLIDKAVEGGADSEAVKITSSLLKDERPLADNMRQEEVGTIAELVTVIATNQSYILAESRKNGLPEIIEGGLPDEGFKLIPKLMNNK